MKVVLDPPAVDKDNFRDAMSRLGAAVSLITTDGPAGRFGLTVTSVCSVSDSPATVLVCVNRSATAHAALLANRALAVNVLASSQQPLASVFASKVPMAQRFEQAQWELGPLGTPMLSGALVCLEGELLETIPVGTHNVLIIVVRTIRSGPHDSALLYFDRSYQSIG